jgi:hypothetical protein
MRKQEFRVGDKIQFRFTPNGKLKLGEILEIKYNLIISGNYSKKDKVARIKILGEKRKYPIKNYFLPYKDLIRAEYNPSERCSR